MEHNKLKKIVKESFLSTIDFSRDVSDEEIMNLIDEKIAKESRNLDITIEQKKRLRNELFDSVRRLDVLQDLVDNPSVTEIMINGPDDIFIEKSGQLMKYNMSFESKGKLEDVIQQIVAKCNRVVNESSPIVDARLENGSRVNIVLAPVALNGPIVTIRRFPDKPITMDKLIELGSITPYLSEYISVLVKAGYNVFISGGTGSGKTTFLNAISDSIPKDERVITIEDNAELQIMGVDNLVKLETRNANVEGCKEISIRDLIKSSLRMRPDRIVVGEVRGGECLDMLQAMNTGHKSMSTGHANSARDMLSRIETMVMMGMELPLPAIRGQIASGIDIIVHLGRLRDKTRKLLEICELEKELDELTGRINVRPLYRYVETGVGPNGRIQGEWEKINELKYTEKLLAAGLTLPST
ncbi:MAG: CpaF family protein [Butyrivibrio sp.]|nr:CpaF family protein [Butyrivibrio sp.]MBQ7428722.1 CpaF family protein [Butyrivibrio sp.]MBQ7431796.1 CpaF family protein [Butyrivibrio sp.]MCR4834015.1 CpaF family protein [Butyrivibrio sp.]